MPRKTGVPSRTVHDGASSIWVELRTSDQSASKSFYSALFGWEYYDQPMPDGPHFSLALLAGRPIAVIALQPVMIGQGEPSKWNTHIAVHNMMIRGRKTSALDPVPLAVRNSQPQRYITAHLVGEPGTLAWD